jgi:ubiquinone biosynthesis protein COQ9
MMWATMWLPMTDECDIWQLRDEIVDASLAHIPFDGWTMAALNRGATDIGLPASDAARAFPAGVIDAIEHHSRLADRRMFDALTDLDTLPIRVRIATAVRTRLEQNAPHREAVRRACTMLALPTNAPMAARCLYRTVDAIWRAAGDTATDWNFYSKRALLAGVYSTTLIYWLDDRSEDLQETWAFLDRRIENVMQVPKLSGRLRELAERLPDIRRFFRA